MAIITSGSTITKLKVNGVPDKYNQNPSNAALVTPYGTNGVQSTGVGKSSYIFYGSIAAANGVTDIAAISGSSTKIIYITSVNIFSLQGTTGVNSYFLIKRSTLNTSGAPTVATPVANDSNDAFSTATLTYYGGIASVGSSVGTVWSGWLNSEVNTNLGIVQDSNLFHSINFLDLYGQPICLRSASESLCLNLNGISVAALTLYFQFLWTEE